jgi:hypothetical protein
MSSLQYGVLSVAVSSLILAIGILVKRFKGVQFGTCCKIQFATPRLSPTDNPTPISNDMIENVIVPVIDDVIRNISKNDNKPDNLV